MKIVLFFILLSSCSVEQSRRLGYALGSASIEGSLDNKKKINGRDYYETKSCDYGFLDENSNELEIYDCILMNEIRYISFVGIQKIVYYFIK